MKRLILLAVAGAVVCLPVVAPALAAPRRTVALKDNVFSPKTLTVHRGTTITWKWKGKSPHNVTVVSGPRKFRSGNRSKGSTYSQKLTRRGTYKLNCTIHAGMTETIRVR